jgi:hydrogenase maturation protein HypF
VRRLRERKSRPDKPFAVMMANIDQIVTYCEISADESSLLGSASAPIVLLRQKADSGIALNTAPHTDMLGVMLPYTPLHHLLVHDARRPLVMTSGNLSDMPVIKDNDQALESLAGIADAFLFHNRDIHIRCDDAVWWVENSAQSELPFTHQPLRRSRGDAPYPISLNKKSPVQLLACGAEMKNTFCLLREDQAFLSQHIGEINSLESLEYFQSTYDHLRALFKVEPQIIAHDLHPEYLTTNLAYQLANTHGLECVSVQHHHAHIAACLAEHGADGPAIGLALDGTGYGPDGAVWGGEVLIADVKHFQRVCHLEYLPLPGGDTAIHRPYRIAWSYLHSTMGLIPDLPGLANTPIDERTIVLRQLERNINTPLTSSAGRLFDAVAAMLGLCAVTTYEGQAAIMLETCARKATDADIGVYTTSITPDGSIKIGEMLREISEETQYSRPITSIAMQFHNTLAHVLTNAVEHAQLRTGLNDVVLSGGVFQNRLILELIRRRLQEQGFNVLWHQKVPANDGGISFGQAVIAMHSQFRS